MFHSWLQSWASLPLRASQFWFITSSVREALGLDEARRMAATLRVFRDGSQSESYPPEQVSGHKPWIVHESSGPIAGEKSQNCVSNSSPPGVFVLHGSAGHVGSVLHDRHASTLDNDGPRPNATCGSTEPEAIEAASAAAPSANVCIIVGKKWVGVANERR